MTIRMLRTVFCAGLALLACAGGLRAEEAKKSQKLTVSADFIVYLARNMLVALNQANQTGNYTVLRQLCSDQFQQENSAERLAKNFEAFRAQKIDLASVMVTTPRFTPPPRLAANGDLVLTGIFPTRPLQVRFALSFGPKGSGWSCTALGVSAEAPSPEATAKKKPKPQVGSNNKPKSSTEANSTPKRKPGEQAPVKQPPADNKPEATTEY